MSTESVLELLGTENLTGGHLGDDLVGGSLISGYIPERTVEHIPQMQLGDGLAGPHNDQQLAIYRDARPLPVDELGMQGPFHWEKVARHRAGRTFPLNYYWTDGLDPTLPGRVPTQDSRSPSVLGPGQNPAGHDGVPAAEIVGNPITVLYTATPNVGWEGY